MAYFHAPACKVDWYTKPLIENDLPVNFNATIYTFVASCFSYILLVINILNTKSSLNGWA